MTPLFFFPKEDVYFHISVDAAMECRLDGQDTSVRFSADAGDPCHLHSVQALLCDPPTLLSNDHLWLFRREYSGRGVKLTTHLHLMPRSEMAELYLHSLSCLHGSQAQGKLFTLHFVFDIQEQVTIFTIMPAVKYLPNTGRFLVLQKKKKKNWRVV
jgi:hypothetical protein